jgi:hypothetical protein
MRVSWSADIEDPDEPARLVNRLERTALGCTGLLDRWNELGNLLEELLAPRPGSYRAGRGRQCNGTVTPRANDFVELGGRPYCTWRPDGV